MVFGYWGIFTAVICLVGFTYMLFASFGDTLPEQTEKDSSAE